MMKDNEEKNHDRHADEDEFFLMLGIASGVLCFILAIVWYIFNG